MKYFVEVRGTDGAFHIEIEDARDIYILMEECEALPKGEARAAYDEGRLVETDKSSARRIWGEEIDDRQLMLRTLKGEFHKKTAMSVSLPKPKKSLNEYLDETEDAPKTEKEEGPFKGVFYFDFFNEDTEEHTVYGFNIVLKNKELNEDFDESYDEHFYNTESTYGVHDWSSRPTDGIVEFGYTSYEVEPKNYKEVVRLWREYFESREDVLATTHVVEVSEKAAHEGDALDVYNEIMEK